MNLVPQNEEFEKAIIVGLLTDPLLLPKITQIVEAEDFYKVKHKEIYEVMVRLDPDNLDSLTVEDKLANNEETLGYFQELVKDSDRLVPNLSNIIFYAETVKGKSKLRAGIDLGRNISAICYSPNAEPEESVQELEGMFAQFLQRRVLDNKLESTRQSFKDFVAELGNRATDTDGVHTGFTDLDLMIHKLEGLIVLAARPGMGKTGFAINVARNVALHKPVLFFSIEQSREQVFERMLASESEVGLEEIRTGAIMPDEHQRIADAEPKLLSILEQLHIDDKADIPTSYITSLSRQKKYEWGDLGLIVIDYLHIMKIDKNQQKVDALGDAAKELRALGKELGCPVLLLAQLSRANEQRTEGKSKNRRPELTDLRGSGEIEQSADIVLFLYRDSYYNVVNSEVDVAEIIIKKNRNGRTGIVLVDWLPEFVKFRNSLIRRK